MNNNLNLKGKLDFSEIDLTAPEIIKLHGSFPSHRPFIITEEDYRTYWCGIKKVDSLFSRIS